MNILFDTNVIVDVFQKNEFCPHSFAAYDVCLLRGHRPYLAVSTMPDLEYLFRRRTGHGADDARRTMGDVLSLFSIMDMAQSDCVLAQRSDMPDYEDALIAFAALRTGMDIIVTRNTQDFANSPVPCMTPQSFVELYKPDGVTYTETSS